MVLFLIHQQKQPSACPTDLKLQHLMMKWEKMRTDVTKFWITEANISLNMHIYNGTNNEGSSIIFFI